jgi:cation diffusion facilitator family transporter
MPSLIQHIPKSEAQASTISLVVGITLLVIKFIAYFLTESTAIFSDAVESIANVLGSSVAFFSLAVAHRPADKDHPWGHGKIEFLSAWFEGGLILMAAVFIVIRTIDALWTGDLLREQSLDTGLILVVLAMAINAGVGLLLIRVGKRQGSMTLEADGKHLISDAITSVGVVLALVIIRITGWKYLDPITAFLMAAYIAWLGTSLVKRASAGLMDKQDPESERRLDAILASHVGPAAQEPRVCAYHKLRHRRNGRYLWVDFHISLPPQTPIREAHAQASAIENEIEQAFGETDATAHLEDCGAEQCPLCATAHARCST